MFCFLLSTVAGPGYQGRRRLLFIRDGDDQTLLLNKTSPSHQPHLLEIFSSRYNLLTQIFLRGVGGVSGHKSPMLSIEFVKCTGRSKNSEKFRGTLTCWELTFLLTNQSFFHSQTRTDCRQWEREREYQISFIQQNISWKCCEIGREVGGGGHWGQDQVMGDGQGQIVSSVQLSCHLDHLMIS